MNSMLGDGKLAYAVKIMMSKNEKALYWYCLNNSGLSSEVLELLLPGSWGSHICGASKGVCLQICSGRTNTIPGDVLDTHGVSCRETETVMLRQEGL